jgi:hypothetical protein
MWKRVDKSNICLVYTGRNNLTLRKERTRMKRAILIGALLLCFGLGAGAGNLTQAGGVTRDGTSTAKTPPSEIHTDNQIVFFPASDVGLEGIKSMLIYVHQSSVGCLDCYSYLVPGDNLETGEPGYFLIYGIPYPQGGPSGK